MIDWQDRLNSLQWRLRNRITWAPPPVKRTISQRWIENHLSGRELTERYDLSRWSQACSQTDFTESLYVLDLCDRYLDTKPNRALDIGSKNWAYLPGLATWSGSNWNGIEIDSHRRYLNLATRKSYAEKMTRSFPGCHYHSGSLAEIDGRYDLITWFLPFVHPASHRAWGLPLTQFNPEQLLTHAFKLLNPGGALFIVNQGKAEAETQQKLFDACHIAARDLGSINSEHSPFRCARHGYIAKKTGTT